MLSPQQPGRSEVGCTSVSDIGLAFLRDAEGLQLKAYPDPASGGRPWTIGYGHTDGVNVSEGQRCTREQAEAWLVADAQWAADHVLALVTVPLTQGQLDALSSFVFNLGFVALAKSTLLKKLNAGDTAGASEQFLRWVYARGRRLPGLVRRRRAERAMFDGGA